MNCKGCIYAYKQHGCKVYSKAEQHHYWVKGKKNMCVLFGKPKENCKDKVVEEGVT